MPHLILFPKYDTVPSYMLHKRHSVRHVFANGITLDYGERPGPSIEHAESFWVEDAGGQTVVYSRRNEETARQAKVLTKARRIGVNFGCRSFWGRRSRLNQTTWRMRPAIWEIVQYGCGWGRSIGEVGCVGRNHRQAP